MANFWFKTGTSSVIKSLFGLFCYNTTCPCSSPVLFCCSGVNLPATLYVTVSPIGDCSCLSAGGSYTMTWDPNDPAYSGGQKGAWTTPARAVSCSLGNGYCIPRVDCAPGPSIYLLRLCFSLGPDSTFRSASNTVYCYQNSVAFNCNPVNIQHGAYPSNVLCTAGYFALLTQ